MKVSYTFPNDYLGQRRVLELNAEDVKFEYEDKECSLKDVFNLIGEIEARIAKLEQGDE